MGDLTNFVKRCKQPAVEYFDPIGSVKALNESVLVRLAGLDETQFDTLSLHPVGDTLGNVDASKRY